MRKKRSSTSILIISGVLVVLVCGAILADWALKKRESGREAHTPV